MERKDLEQGTAAYATSAALYPDLINVDTCREKANPAIG
jgi:hypothetical protein